MKRIVAFCILFLSTQSANANVKTQALGKARSVVRSLSASRDAPALGYVAAPRVILSAFGEFSLFSIKSPNWNWYIGFIGGLEVESETTRTGGRFLLPVGDIRYWRGYNGIVVASENKTLSKRLCSSCQLEFGIMLRHESEHYTGSNNGGSGTDYSDVGHVGDFVLPDVSFAFKNHSWHSYARLQTKFFIPGRSAYSIGPGLDLHIRWTRPKTFQPFASLFSETQKGGQLRLKGVGNPVALHPRLYPSTFTFRGLTGVAMPSSLGSILVFLSFEIGHRKGLAVHQQEKSIGFGFRLALDPR